MTRYTLVFGGLLLLSFHLSAQKETYNWTFGGRGGLTFHTGEPQQILSKSNSFEGCTTISDSSGNLLFYADMWNIRNLDHQNLSGLPFPWHSSQGSLLVPWPENDSLYYLFLAPTEDNGPFQYLVVNTQLNGGLGGLQTPPTFLFDHSTEKQTAVRHANGRDYWLVTHHFPSDSFYSFLITPTGIDTTPVISEVGSVHPPFPIEFPFSNQFGTIGCMKISPNGERLAVAIYSEKVVEVFDFNDSTGQITNPLQIYFPQSTPSYSPYGVEFSQDGDKLFVTEEVPDGKEPKIHAYQFASNGAILSHRLIYKSLTGNFGQLQLAPNGYIYFTDYGKNYLGAIKNPNGTLPEVQASVSPMEVILDSIDADGNITFVSTLGLPNFPVSYFADPQADFYVPTFCMGDTARFNGFSNFGATEWDWEFDDPASATADTSSLQEPWHVFSDTGAYTVQLIAKRDGKADTVIKTIQVYPALTFTPLADTSVCQNQSPIVLLQYSDTSLNYVWPGGSTQHFHAFSQTDTLVIVIKDEFGCKKKDTVIVEITPHLKPNLGPDTVICDGMSLTLNAWLPQIDTWLWNTGDTSSQITVSQSGQYSVQMHIGECTSHAEVHIRYDTPPNIHLGEDTLICEGESLTLYPGPANSYLWSTGDTTASLTVAGGVYEVLASSEFGCRSEASIDITKISLPEGTITFRDDTLFATEGYSYQWFRGDTLLGDSDTPYQPIAGYGKYHVIMTDSYGCQGEASFTLVSPPLGELCEDILVYPNPNQGNFTIDLQGVDIQRVWLADMPGHVIWQMEEAPTSRKLELPLENQLAEGVYILYVKSEDCERLFKVLITR